MTRKEIMILADTIQGEINRMCVTSDLAEMDTMALHARENLKILQKANFERITEETE